MQTPRATSPGWLDTFEAFSLHHFAVLLVCAGLCVVVMRFARSEPRREGRVRAAWAWLTFASAVLVTIYWLDPARYDPGISWPLHLCDLAAWGAPLAMLGRRRWAKTLLFFWGLGLSSQGLLTPTLEQGIASPAYWLFWTQHLGVVGGGLYLAVVNAYRPTPRDLGLALVVTLLVMLAMIPINLALGANYFYVGDTLPDRPTLLDHLGPWPGRIVWIGLLGAVAITLTWLVSEGVWRLAEHRARGPAGTGRDATL